MPIDAELERYKFRVVKAGVAVREVIVLISPGSARTWTYTASQQTSDSITPGDPVKLEMMQMSHLVFDGNATTVIL